ncbi:hypothetical protein FPANT_2429 [Fusarium pseudoanthophilum]|uniref:Uncharacterized protein n=1 Tax=Fusarium pseudoanthophilum TaxID=48495 RepID=A0A8H5PPD2_9HYPO|nr:hypothetical protein FPANT_2429 [Fusarium pseudoanthophilum]
MPKKTAQQKEAARKGFERRDANRQQKNGGGPGEQQSHQSGAGHGNMSRNKSRNFTSIGVSLASKHGIRKRENGSGMSIADSVQRRNSNGQGSLANTSYGRGPENRSARSNQLEERTDRHDGNQIITNPEAVRSMLCAECQGSTHIMKDCITTVTGGIRGCIFCNNKNHVTDHCRQFTRLTLAEKVKLLVTDRAGKPPIFTDTAWWVYLYRFLTVRETMGQQIPDKFPWTRDFSRDIYRGKEGHKSIREYQRDFNRTKSVGVLPRDWRMQSMNDVFTNFWDREGKVWPSRLNESPSLTDANAERTTSAEGTANVDVPTTAEVRRLGETVIRQALQLVEKDREIERLKKENVDLKRRLAQVYRDSYGL